LQTFLADLNVNVSSTPPGPSFPAASWITFYCHASNGSGLYSYLWKVYCSATGSVVHESVRSTSNSFSLKSTPPVCSDILECIVEDQVLPATGSAFATITTVVGVCIL